MRKKTNKYNIIEMNYKIYLFLFLILLYFSLLKAEIVEFKELEQGIFYKHVKIFKNNEIADKINIIKINPSYYKFKVLIRPKENGLPEMYDILNWHKIYSNAKILFNSSYYGMDRYPSTVIKEDGKFIGKSASILTKGAIFVANPDDNILPQADIIEANNKPINLSELKYKTVVQSMPVLLSSGNIKVKKSNLRANRTVIAKDKSGNIVLFITEGSEKYKSFTLYEMAEWIRDCGLDIVLAVNLDGGYESQLSIKTKNFKYATSGQLETNDTGDISGSGIKLKIPVVIGVFKKGVDL